jgi:hypothetical protein
MKKINIASFALIACLSISQAAFANDEQTIIQELDQQLIQELTKEDVLSATQDYVLEQTIRPQSRRSPLFAHILDTMSKNATMAQVDQVLPIFKS